MAEKPTNIMSHALIIDEISKDTRIKREIVELVLSRYIDIAVEQLVNGRGFTMKNVFTAYYAEKSGGRSPLGEVMPRTRFITLHTNKVVKDLHALQNTLYKGQRYVVNRDTWKGASKWLWSPEHVQRRREWAAAQKEAQQQPVKKAEEEEFHNPFLEEDE